MADINPTDHTGLVRSVAHRYRWALCTSLELEDLMQEGMRGVLRAIEGFNPEKGAFSTYAMPWINHFIQRAVHMHSRTVRVPRTVSKKAWLAGAPIPLNAVGLDKPLNWVHREQRGQPGGSGAGCEPSLSDIIAFKIGVFVDPEGPKSVEESERRELVAHLMSTLPERHQTVLRLRFFEDLTLHETGRRIGTTKERARQIQAEAIEIIGARLRQEAED